VGTKFRLAAAAFAAASVAVVPSAASADASNPPNCFGQVVVAPAAQSGTVGPYERSIAPPSSPPGTIATGVAAFKANCGR
jgi:hypothetical protein